MACDFKNDCSFRAKLCDCIYYLQIKLNNTLHLYAYVVISQVMKGNEWNVNDHSMICFKLLAEGVENEYFGENLRKKILLHK